MENREQLINGLKAVKEQIAQILATTEQQVAIVASFRESEAGIATKGAKAKTTLSFVILGVVYGLFMAFLRDWLSLFVMAACGVILYTQRTKKSKLKTAAFIVAAVDIVWFFCSMFKHILAGEFFLLLLFVLLLAVSVAAVRFVIKSQNAATALRNEKIAQENAALQERYDATVCSLSAMKKQLYTFSDSWYPRDYYSLESVDFFLSAILNFKADTMKEAVLLLDDTQYKQKMLASQKEIERLNREQVFNQQTMIKQLRFANIMSVQNLALQHSQLGAINNNTRAVQANTAAVRNAGRQVASAGRSIVGAINRLR